MSIVFLVSLRSCLSDGLQETFLEAPFHKVRPRREERQAYIWAVTIIYEENLLKDR